MLILIPTPGSRSRIEREGGHDEGTAGAGWGGMRRTGARYVRGAGRGRTTMIWWECGAFLMDHSVPSNGIPSNVRVLAIPKKNALHATNDYITC